jgi:hypothetical protein
MPCKTSVFARGISAVCLCQQIRFRKPETIVFGPHSLAFRAIKLDGFKVRLHELNFSYVCCSLNYKQLQMV